MLSSMCLWFYVHNIELFSSMVQSVKSKDLIGARRAQYERVIQWDGIWVSAHIRCVLSRLGTGYDQNQHAAVLCSCKLHQ